MYNTGLLLVECPFLYLLLFLKWAIESSFYWPTFSGIDILD